jgi:hypothetical protein
MSQAPSTRTPLRLVAILFALLLISAQTGEQLYMRAATDVGRVLASLMTNATRLNPTPADAGTTGSTVRREPR